MKHQDTRKVAAYLLGIGGLVAAIVAGVQYYTAGKTRETAARIKPQPQHITCAELGARGPGDNLYVQVTNLEFGDGALTAGREDNWRHVFLPAYPKGRLGRGGGLRPPPVVVYSTDIADVSELRSFAARGSVVGIVTNPLEGMPREVHKFREKHPGFENKEIWVVDVSREVPTMAKSQAHYFVASLLVCAAVVCFGMCGLLAYRIGRSAEPVVAAATRAPVGHEDLASALAAKRQLPDKTAASELAARLEEEWR